MRQLTLSMLRAGGWQRLLFLSAILLVAACDRDDPTAPVGMVTGTVLNSATGDPVAGAEVIIGPTTVTTGSDGRFVLTGLTPRTATLRCIAIGFDDFWAEITVPSGSVTRDISLTPDPAALHISGVMGSLHQVIRVSRAGAGVIDGALVTVNGVAIPHCCGDVYSGDLPEAIPAGSPLNLKVSSAGVTIEATGNVPEAPVLTSPARETVFTLNDSIGVTWASATDPGGFEVHFSAHPEWWNWTFETPGTARQVTSPATTQQEMLASLLDPDKWALWAGEAVIGISVSAVNKGSFTEPVHPDSRIFIRASIRTEITVRP